MKGRVFDVCGAFPINAFSVTMREMTGLIGRTYKKGSGVKRCLEKMKYITLPKPNPKMGDDGVTP